MRHFKLLLLTILFSFFNETFGQLGDSTKFSFSGIIYNSDELKTPLGKVNISKTNLLGTSSNVVGEFFIDVKPNDTLIFSHIGFHPITLTIPDSLTSGSLVAKLFLVSDTVSLEQVYISSLQDFNSFKNQFLSMDVVPNQELSNAQNNIKLSMYEARTTTESTTEDKLEASLQKEANKSIYFGQLPPEHMVNFVSVAAGLISMIPNKKEKDKFYRKFINSRNQNNIVYIKP
ncbi:carboxypeptidase-like regulatory domain-containing protein [Vicingaceae bacterium]|jgi:hypothetical protein|nr:carboxypeptidase-like regulatory domain-containing protein [Vicingaceae bacterium]